MGTRKYLVNVDVLRRSQLNLKLSFMTMLTIFAPHLPHVFMPAHVNLLKLFRVRGAQVLPHFNGNMFRQHWQQKTFLRKIIRPDDWDGQIWNAEVNKIKKLKCYYSSLDYLEKCPLKLSRIQSVVILNATRVWKSTNTKVKGQTTIRIILLAIGRELVKVDSQSFVGSKAANPLLGFSIVSHSAHLRASLNDP